MLKTKHVIGIFVPALLLAGIFLFIRVIQYEPLFPDQEELDARKNQAINIPIFPDDPIMGSKKAKVTIIAFEDFGCPACKEQMELIGQIIESYPDSVKIIWKGLPVTQFPHSTEKAHQYSYCAYEQNKFAEFKNFAFANYSNLSDTVLEVISREIGLDENALKNCLDSDKPNQYVERVKQIARLLNIQSVPTIFMDGKQINTPEILEEWKSLLRL